VDVFVALSVLAAVLFWGRAEMVRWGQVMAESPVVLTVAGVQVDEPSIFRKTEDTSQAAFGRFAERTAMVALGKPDIVIWPETVTEVWNWEGMKAVLEQVSRMECPLLIGALDMGRESTWWKRPELANASLLIGTNQTIEARYWKQHLVPFGEYIPGDRWFSILEKLSPVGFSCEFGKSNVLMKVTTATGERVAISPLICFEDTVARLSRRAVRDGAQVLVNQSNDAWFSHSSEGRQHHDQAVFRAVENRTPLVRVSNTGVSGIIDPLGRFGDNSAFFVAPVTVRTPDWPLSLYTRYGDWIFAIPCAMALALLMAWYYFLATDSHRFTQIEKRE